MRKKGELEDILLTIYVICGVIAFIIISFALGIYSEALGIGPEVGILLEMMIFLGWGSSIALAFWWLERPSKKP